MKNCIAFEFGYLVANTSSAASDHNVCVVRVKSFEWLKKQYLNDNAEYRKLLRICSYGSQEAFQLRNYVGVIATPYGEQIEVLPKIARQPQPSKNNQSSQDSQPEAIKTERSEHARQALLKMLRHLHQFRNIESQESMIQASKLPLLEVFIRQFLLSVNTLVKRGLRSDYCRVEANQNFLKGRLLVAQQLRHNIVNQHKFYVEYDEFLPDRPVNRLIHSALLKVSGLCKSESNQRLCRELRFAFADVPCSKSTAADFDAMRMDRGMELYQKSIAWVRLILNGNSPLSMNGQESAISLLFPMEAVFESYVAAMLRKQLQGKFEIKEQARSKSLVRHADQDWFRLKPDLLLLNPDDQSIAHVMDTKWKLLNSTQSNGTDKYGISQGDMYQMFAYGHKYLGNCKSKKLVLIYPMNENFTEQLPVFTYADDFELVVVPFDIDAGCLVGSEILSESHIMEF